jgi:hypothetical protein
MVDSPLFSAIKMILLVGIFKPHAQAYGENVDPMCVRPH